MQSTSPSPHTWQEVYYALAAFFAGIVAIASFTWNVVMFIALRKSRAATDDHSRADTDHTRAETQHLRLETADFAIQRFLDFYRKLEDLSDELDKQKLIAEQVPVLEAHVQALTLQNSRIKAFCDSQGIVIPADTAALTSGSK